MSQRQGGPKDLDELERERSQNKLKAAERSRKEELERQSLEETRKKAREKFNSAVTSKGPRKNFLNLTQHQIVFLSVGIVILILIVLPFMGESVSESNKVIDPIRIAAFNKENKGFRVESNEFFEGWTLPEAESHLSGITNGKKLSTCSELQIENLPKKYNSRTKQSACITPIYDQGKCSSSYAFAVAGMMTNRYCLLHNGNKKFDVSAQFFVGCESSNGCEGGDLGAAALVAQQKGAVNTNCLPYNPERLDACDSKALASCFRLHITNLCTTNEAEQIKRHIYKAGPVASLIKASRELLTYKGGIYDATKATLIEGAQAVKIIGWDTDKDNNVYWVVENSWGSSWGIGGMVKVRVGSDPLLEKNVVIGTVDSEIKGHVSNKEIGGSTA